MRWLIVLALVAAGTGAGCVRVKTDPVKVKPIHITVDVNLRIERELEDFFGDIDTQDPSVNQD